MEKHGYMKCLVVVSLLSSLHCFGSKPGAAAGAAVPVVKKLTASQIHRQCWGDISLQEILADSPEKPRRVQNREEVGLVAIEVMARPRTAQRKNSGTKLKHESSADESDRSQTLAQDSFTVSD